MIRQPLVMFVSFNNHTWEQNRESIIPRLQALDGDEFVDLAFGAWVFDPEKCYPTIHYLRDFLHRKNIPYFVMPLPDPFVCSVTQPVEAALTERVNVAVHNLEIDGEKT